MLPYANTYKHVTTHNTCLFFFAMFGEGDVPEGLFWVTRTSRKPTLETPSLDCCLRFARLALDGHNGLAMIDSVFLSHPPPGMFVGVEPPQPPTYGIPF